MTIERNRFIYFILIFFVISLGLGSRFDFFPTWVHLYIGDVLWALMIFLIIGMLFKSKNTYWVAVLAISICFFIDNNI